MTVAWACKVSARLALTVPSTDLTAVSVCNALPLPCPPADNGLGTFSATYQVDPSFVPTPPTPDSGSSSNTTVIIAAAAAGGAAVLGAWCSCPGAPRPFGWVLAWHGGVEEALLLQWRLWCCGVS